MLYYISVPYYTHGASAQRFLQEDEDEVIHTLLVILTVQTVLHSTKQHYTAHC